MLKFRPGAGAVVAADTQNAVGAVDDALLSLVRMYASVLEAAESCDVPVAQSQKLYSDITASLNQLLAGRADLASAIRRLAHIKGQSNFAPEDYGCPAGWVARVTPTIPETA